MTETIDTLLGPNSDHKERTIKLLKLINPYDKNIIGMYNKYNII